MRIKLRHQVLAVACAAGIAGLAASPSRLADVDWEAARALSRTVDVGELHNRVLASLMERGLPVNAPFTEDEMGLVLDAAAVEILATTEFPMLDGWAPEAATAFLTKVARGTTSQVLDLMRRAGAFAEGGQDKRVADHAHDVLDWMAHRGILTDDFVGEMAAIRHDFPDVPADRRHEFIREARRRIAALELQGVDLLAADIYLEVLDASSRFWINWYETPIDDTIAPHGWRDVNDADAAGGAIGGGLGAVIGGVIGALGGPVAAEAGATVGGLVGGGTGAVALSTAAIIQEVGQAPDNGGQSGGGSSGGSTGGSSGGSTGGSSGGSTGGSSGGSSGGASGGSSGP